MKIEKKIETEKKQFDKIDDQIIKSQIIIIECC